MCQIDAAVANKTEELDIVNLRDWNTSFANHCLARSLRERLS